MQRNLTEQPLVLFADDKAEKQIDPSSTFYQVSLAYKQLTIKYVHISLPSEEVVIKKNLIDKNGLIDELQNYTSLSEITEKMRAELTELIQENHQALIPISACVNAVVNAFKEFYDVNKATEEIIRKTALACISGVVKSNGELNGKIHNTVAEHFIVYLRRYLLATATSRNLADILDFYISTTNGSAEISPHVPKNNATSESPSSTINNINPVTSYIPAAAIDITTSAPATPVLGTIPSVPATPRKAMSKVRADSQTSTATITSAAGIASSPTTNAETIANPPTKFPTTPSVATFNPAQTTSDISSKLTSPVVGKIKRNAAPHFPDNVMHLVNNPMMLAMARKDKNKSFQFNDPMKLGALGDVLERILLPAIITASKITCDEAIWNIDCINNLDPNMEVKRSTNRMLSTVLVQMLNVLEINFLLKLHYNLHVKPSDTVHVNFNIQTSNPRFALQFFHKSELPASQPKCNSSLRMSG